jgi:DNA-binding NarL/FixJ family response regulator
MERSAPAPVRLVICDDNDELRALLATLLEHGGALEVVGEAGDGHGAPDVVRAAAPDVVLLDLHMPGPDASRLVRELRAAAPGAAIVTLSGDDPRRAVDAVALDEIALHLPKTADPLSLRDILTDVAQARRAQRAQMVDFRAPATKEDVR